MAGSREKDQENYDYFDFESTKKVFDEVKKSIPASRHSEECPKCGGTKLSTKAWGYKVIRTCTLCGHSWRAKVDPKSKWEKLDSRDKNPLSRVRKMAVTGKLDR